MTPEQAYGSVEQQTITHLELFAALAGAQLAKVLTTKLMIPIRQFILCTDSTMVFTWLQSDTCPYKVFFCTCVAETQDLTVMPGAMGTQETTSR